MLMAEYGTGQIPLSKCAHLFGLSTDEAAKRAGRQSLPVPTFRAGTQKSPWMIDAARLATYLDRQKERAESDWAKLNCQR
ncbi:pyocin activator PrtN family protein [Tahibacter soli]|uniref:pyocin activator PrtN family protein n=1 Tax=Tahibacter soli TaxID=2983605 RepID=UPI003CCDBC40